MHDIILLDDTRHEIGPALLNVDFEVGRSDASNDFEFQSAPVTGIGGLYVPGTEFGGLIEYTHEVSDSGVITYRGFTWRGLLAKWIITPPAGSDYYTVRDMEANDAIRSILSTVLGGFFYVPDTDSGLTITSYQFKLYTTVLDGLEDMLEAFGFRLYIHAEKMSVSAAITIVAEAVEATRIAGVFNEDSAVPLSYTRNGMGVNHLICMGQGELQNRLRVDLYMDDRGQVSRTQYYTGFEERQEYYDYANAESEDDLIKNGRKRLIERASSDVLGISSVADDITLEVGDIVSGVFPDGKEISAPITRKIFTIAGGDERVEYKIKGEM